MLYRPESHEQLVDRPWDADEIRATVRRLVADADAAYRPDSFWPANEWDAWESEPPLKTLMWGASGTMLAAHAMHGWTGEERWADGWRKSADELIRRWEPDGLWTQRLYRRVERFLGPAHGFVSRHRG